MRATTMPTFHFLRFITHPEFGIPDIAEAWSAGNVGGDSGCLSRCPNTTHSYRAISQSMY
jgi:hypothetical protein